MSQEPPPAERSASTFGEELRKEREIRGISLQEIADSTKISKRFLDAIERNDQKILPAPVFTKGFVREYARYLGLEADDFVSRYSQHAKQTEETALASDEAELLRARMMPNSSVVWPKVLGALMLLAGLATAGYWYLNRGSKEDLADSAGDTTTEVQASEQGAQQQPLPRQGSGVSDAADSAESQQLTMRLVFRQNSWISLDADGKVVLNDEVVAGDERTFQANDSFKLRSLGNAGGVDIWMNGQKLPTLGDQGEVIKNRTFDRKSHPVKRTALR